MTAVEPLPERARELLREGLARLGLALDAAQRERLLAYLALLLRWNRAYNLTAVREPVQMVPRHLLDSLAILPWLRGDAVLDLGSGAGLPGIPLAVARPRTAFTLLDASLKKTRFLRQACRELGLARVAVVRARAEDYAPARPFPTVVARAVAGAGALAGLAGPLLAPGGRLLVMAGRRPARPGLPAGFALQEVVPLQVPGLGAARHLLVVARRP